MARFLKWPVKDPDSSLDYEVDWLDRLGADTLASASFSYTGTPDSPPLVLSSITNTTTHAQLRIAGGADGTLYKVLNRVVTTGGNTMDQTILLKVRQR